ncbi:MAG: hypothetical protein SGPRY_007549 [Prymnesium sp.]
MTALACEAALAEDDVEGRLLPKPLLHLDLEHAGDANLAVLLHLLHEVEPKLVDKNSLKTLAKAGERVRLIRGRVQGGGEVSPVEAEALANERLEAQRALREKGRVEEGGEGKQQRLTPKKEKRRLARVKGTPRHLGHADENEIHNLNHPLAA